MSYIGDSGYGKEVRLTLPGRDIELAQEDLRGASRSGTVSSIAILLTDSL